MIKRIPALIIAVLLCLILARGAQVKAFDQTLLTTTGTGSGGSPQTPWTTNVNAAGFTLFGSWTTSGTLTLGSTSNATKGNILFGNSAYDEVNNRLLIGTTTNLTNGGKLQIVGAADMIQTIIRANATQTKALLQVQDSIGNSLAQFGSTGGLSVSSVCDLLSTGVYFYKDIAVGSNGPLLSQAGSLSATAPIILVRQPDNNTGVGSSALHSIDLIANGINVFSGNNGRAGIGTTSPSAKLHVAGANDIVQLLVKANTTTQTAHIQDWQSGAANVLADINASGQIESQLTTGTAPMVVASTTVVSNLNADLLDGNHAAAFMPAATNVLLTNQSADIGAANLATTTGLYRVSYSLQDTTSDGAAGSVTLTLSYTDGAGAATATASQILTSTGRAEGSVYIQLASGNLTYAITHSGSYGNAIYALYLSTEKLN